MSKNQQDEKWQSLVKDGKEAGRNKNLRMSAEKFQRAYEASRSFAIDDLRRGESAYYLAYARYLEHQNIEAVQLFEESLEYMLRDQSHLQRCAQIHSTLAAIYFGMKQLELAEHHVKESLALEQKEARESWENIQLLSSILVTLQKYSEAVPVLEKLIACQKLAHPSKFLCRRRAHTRYAGSHRSEASDWKAVAGFLPNKLHSFWADLR